MDRGLEAGGERNQDPLDLHHPPVAAVAVVVGLGNRGPSPGMAVGGGRVLKKSLRAGCQLFLSFERTKQNVFVDLSFTKP